MKSLLARLAAASMCGALVLMGVPSATATETITTSWSTQLRKLSDGRTYYVQVPSCAPTTAAACSAFMTKPRQLIMYLHHAGGPEDATTAANWLAWFRIFHSDTLFVYGVAKEARVWDAGVCCTSAPVDDVGYLTGVLNDVAAVWPVNRKRVGLMGNSNGGMLAERAVCEQPTIFPAGASQAGTYAGPCNVGKSRIVQYHGAADKVVPVEGGTTWVHGLSRTFPSASSLGGRMLQGSTFQLEVFPGYGHGLPPDTYRKQVVWLTQNFPS